MSKCEICKDNPSKYTCPKCSKKTCCLQCVKEHKQQYSCDGVRDKTAYVPMKQFTDFTLLSDYRFLEEADRIAENCKRDPKRKRNNHRGYLNQLRKSALKRNIRLKLLPYPMMKRKNNSTRLTHYQHGDILWHMELIFPQAEAKYIEKRVNENSLMSDILKQYIHPTESDPVRRQKLKSYCMAGMENCKIFMKKEGCPANNVSYHVMDLQKTLAENLADKEMIEYPVLHVVLPSSVHSYPSTEKVSVVTDSESESDSESDSEDDCIQPSNTQIAQQNGPIPTT